MLTVDNKGIWYGLLKNGKTKIPVIYDPRLTPSIKGGIYLYNSERDAIVQYVWDIVKDSIEEVDKDKKKTLKKDWDAKWKTRRREFSKGKSFALAGESSSKAKQAPKPAKSWEDDDIDADNDDSGDIDVDDMD